MTLVRSRFRALMGHFATGVTVVTTAEDGSYYGMTVNAFCSVSLDPCLVLVSLRETSATRDVIRRSGVYAVNVLTAEQQPLAERFARHDLDPGKRFTGIPLQTHLTGAPVFTDALAYLECRVVAEYPGGDHALLVGEVVGLEYRAEAGEAGADPLLFYRSAYATLPEALLPADLLLDGIAASAARAERSGGRRRLWERVRAVWIAVRGQPLSRCGVTQARDATLRGVSDIFQRDHTAALARPLARATEKDASV